MIFVTALRAVTRGSRWRRIARRAQMGAHMCTRFRSGSEEGAMAAQLANDRLAEAMRRAGLSNKALARRIRAMAQKQGKPVACDHTSVSRWLSGTVPRIQTARLIAGVLTECIGAPMS